MKLILGIAGIIIGGMVSAGCSFYYKKRFGEEISYQLLACILDSALTGAAGVLFSIYGYGALTAINYMVLISFTMMLAVIDKEKTVIPNLILLIMCGFRVVTVTAECILAVRAGGSVSDILVPVLLGIFYGAFVFVVAFPFTKGGIGAGDIKLFAVIGMYVGNTAIVPILLFTFVGAVVVAIVKMILKKATMKDSFSLGPYIATGTLIVLILGV